MFLGPACLLSVPATVSSSIHADTMYVYCNGNEETVRPKIVAFDACSRSVETNFGKKVIG
jgi:hypothetical protein